MGKIKIYSIGNQDKFNYYIFEKTKQTHKELSKLFKEIFNANWPLVEENEDNGSVKQINITKNKDFHQSLHIMCVKPKKNITRIDIFFGNKKMFITIQCSFKKRKEFNSKLGEMADLPKPKKFNKCRK